jgi:hypothetical protein
MQPVRMGPPSDLITRLVDEFELEYFVETGTWYADTSVWASEHFKQVATVELSKEIYDEIKMEYGHISNIEFFNGTSATMLPEMVAELAGPVVYWLDAHYCGGPSAGGANECPLLSELDSISHLSNEPWIFIDDARLFLSPPPRPHDPKEWPTIDELVAKLNDIDKDYYVVVTEDVIIAVPPRARATVEQYAQDVSTKNWEETDIDRAFDTLRTHVRNRTINILKKVGLFPVVRRLHSTIRR